MSFTTNRTAALAAFGAGLAVIASTGLPAIAVASTGLTAPDTSGSVRRFVVQTTGALPSAASLDRILGGSVSVSSTRAIGQDLAVVTVRRGLNARAAAGAARALAATPAIAAAAPDTRITATGAASPVRDVDPLFGRQWDLWDAASLQRAGGYGVDAPRAWQKTLGSKAVTVAVLDTGITAHPDLTHVHASDGYDFVTNDPGLGVYSNDGDGWDADPTDPGDHCEQDGSTDSSWHGTFVTGEIAASHDTIGFAGEAPGVTVEPVRVLGGCGGSESDEIAAITWASGGRVTLPDAAHTVIVNPRPARVLSMSLGAAGVPCDGVLQGAVNAAVARGATIVVAAGNEGAPVATSAPADCTGVVRVAATTRGGTLAEYSNYGTPGAAITIAAPGGDDAYPVWGDSWITTATGAAGSPAAAGEDGTSMATPRVAAAVALLLSVHPSLSPTQVAARLTATATPFPTGSGCTRVRCGAGIVDAGNLVGADARFVLVVRPAISGRAVVGRTLTAHLGRFIGTPSRIEVRWYRDGHAIAHAARRTHRVTAADRGTSLTVRITAIREGTASATARSAGLRIRR